MTRSSRSAHQAPPGLVIALDDADIDWGFTPAEVEAFRRHWNQGTSLADIAEALGRPPLEVALLALDQAEKRKIKPRPGAWKGGH